MDSLQSYESGHGDALCPIAKEAEKSFMGDHLRVGPVSTEEYRRRQDIIDEKMAALLQAITLSSSTDSCQHIIQPLQFQSTTRQDGPQINGSIASLVEVHSNRASAASPHTANSFPAIITSHGTPTNRDQRILPRSASPKPVPIPGISISDLGHGPTAWRKAIQQWEEPDPSTGLVALKNWPREWYTGAMRTHTGAKRTTRKAIADEYNRLVLSRCHF